MKAILTFLTCLVGLCPAETPPDAVKSYPVLENHVMQQAQNPLATGESFFAGPYLAGQFAQRRHDWSNAAGFMQKALDAHPDNPQLLNRTMILLMGSGKTDEALDIARRLKTQDGKSSLTSLFLAIEAFKAKNYEQAALLIEDMSEGSLTDFMLPLLQGWTAAAKGELKTDGLNQNHIHLYHSVLIADYLNRSDRAEAFLQNALSVKEISLQDLEKIGDAYVHIGKTETAQEIYEKIVDKWPENRPLIQKLEMLKQDKPVSAFEPVRAPEEGVADALYDMARLLYQEYSDDSARVFAHLALYLDPALTDAHLLLGYITARNERYEEAIAYYQNIEDDHDKYVQARRMAADMLADANHIDEALAVLEGLVNEKGDLEALIQIGDIYRQNKEFKKAVSAYNRAAENFDAAIPKEYWQIHYVRGMSYERLGQWNKAEADLKAALAHRPNHPLILNYLGYAWADQGINLEESLNLIRKASALEPADGYIMDSLGWVLYRMGRYEEAVAPLERAAGLLPYDPVINDHLGDAYWKAGRKLEARFQWLRAKNHSDDQTLIQSIETKLENGRPEPVAIKEAASVHGEKTSHRSP